MCELIEPVPSTTPVQEAFSRGKWLLGLLILQSTSSFILDSYSVSVDRAHRMQHAIVAQTLFFTPAYMCVRARDHGGCVQRCA